MDEELKNKIEALLFATGKKMSLENIGKLCKCQDLEAVKSTLLLMKKDYDGKNSPLMLIEDGPDFKLTVREKYLPLVRKIVVDTELSKTVMETLAVIAWKSPVLQSDVIKVRTNKAYDHISQIEEIGFISKEKHGRTQLIKLTQRFFDYFDLKSKEDIANKFKAFKENPPNEEKPDSGQAKLEVYSRQEPKLEVYDVPKDEPAKSQGNDAQENKENKEA